MVGTGRAHLHHQFAQLLALFGRRVARRQLRRLQFDRAARFDHYADAAFARLRAMNPDALFLYTRGAQGASLHQGLDTWHARPARITVVDTVGAGDASLAGLVAGLMLHPERGNAGHLARSVAAGAAACMVAGAAPVGQEQVEGLAAGIRVGTSG